MEPAHFPSSANSRELKGFFREISPDVSQIGNDSVGVVHEFSHESGG